MGIRGVKSNKKPIAPHERRKCGPPAKYPDPEGLERGIEKYFERCKKANTPPTVSGLAYDLGFCDRQSLYDYGNKEAFACTVKRAKLRIEASLHAALLQKRVNTAGAIFTLKCGFGYYDRQVEQQQKPIEKLCKANSIDIE